MKLFFSFIYLKQHMHQECIEIPENMDKIKIQAQLKIFQIIIKVIGYNLSMRIVVITVFNCHYFQLSKK